MKDKYLPVLKEINRITKGKAFLMYGTLLGCVRDKEFIPWDDDMDIGILEEEWKDEYFTEFNKIYRTTNYKHNGKFSKVRLFYNNGHTCFNIMRKEGDQRYFTEGGTTMRIPDEYIKEFKYVDFYDTKARIPVNSEEMLSWDYGDWKTIQKEYSWINKPGRVK